MSAPISLHGKMLQSFILKLQCYFHVLPRDQRHLPNCRYQEGHREVGIHKWGVRVCSCSSSRALHWSCVIVSWDVKRYSHFSSAVSGTAEGRKHLDLRDEQTPEHRGQLVLLYRQPSSFPHTPALSPCDILCLLWSGEQLLPDSAESAHCTCSNREPSRRFS